MLVCIKFVHAISEGSSALRGRTMGLNSWSADLFMPVNKEAKAQRGSEICQPNSHNNQDEDSKLLTWQSCVFFHSTTLSLSTFFIWDIRWNIVDIPRICFCWLNDMV